MAIGVGDVGDLDARVTSRRARTPTSSTTNRQPHLGAPELARPSLLQNYYQIRPSMPSSSSLRGPSRANKSAASQILSYRASNLLPRASPIAAARAQPSHPQQQLRSPALRQSFLHQSPKMSTMPASHGHSQPCCNIPPVISTGYQAKGSYEEIGGFKTCMSPPARAGNG